MAMCLFVVFFFFKQKTAYEMRISDWSSDVCSSDLLRRLAPRDDGCRAVEGPLAEGAGQAPPRIFGQPRLLRTGLSRRRRGACRACRRAGAAPRSPHLRHDDALHRGPSGATSRRLAPAGNPPSSLPTPSLATLATTARIHTRHITLHLH